MASIAPTARRPRARAEPTAAAIPGAHACASPRLLQRRRVRVVGSALCLGVAMVASACGPPPRLRGPVADITVRDARAGVGIGERIRWGGVIVGVRPKREKTCFEILSRPLDIEARPIDTDETDGRFIACAPGFYDPEVYKEGREVTVIGTVRPPTTREIGDYEYEYPRLDAEDVYLWPERRRDYPPEYYDPWWGTPYWGRTGASAGTGRSWSCRGTAGRGDIISRRAAAAVRRSR